MNFSVKLFNFIGWKRLLPTVPPFEMTDDVSKLESDLNDMYGMKDLLISYNVKEDENRIQEFQLVQ